MDNSSSPHRRLAVFQQLCASHQEPVVTEENAMCLPMVDTRNDNIPLPQEVIDNTNWCTEPQTRHLSVRQLENRNQDILVSATPSPRSLLPTSLLDAIEWSAQQRPIINSRYGLLENPSTVSLEPVMDAINPIVFSPRPILKTASALEELQLMNLSQEPLGQGMTSTEFSAQFLTPMPIFNSATDFTIQPVTPYLLQTETDYVNACAEFSQQQVASGILGQWNSMAEFPVPYNPQGSIVNELNPLMEPSMVHIVPTSILHHMTYPEEPPISYIAEGPLQDAEIPIVEFSQLHLEPEPILPTANYGEEYSTPYMHQMQISNNMNSTEQLVIPPIFQWSTVENMNDYIEPPISVLPPNTVMENITGHLDMSGLYIPHTVHYIPENLDTSYNFDQYLQSNINFVGEPMMMHVPQSLESGYMMMDDQNNEILSTPGYPFLPQGYVPFAEEVPYSYPPMEAQIFPVAGRSDSSYPMPESPSASEIYLYEQMLNMYEILQTSETGEDQEVSQESPIQSQEESEAYQHSETSGSSQNEEMPVTQNGAPQVTSRQEILCNIPCSTEHYILGDRIGTGSYSHIYKAVDKKNNTIIAVKSYHMSSKNRAHFIRAGCEMAFLKMLNHPFIITSDFAEIKKQYIYLGTEYSPYGSLQNYIEHKVGLSEQTVQSIMKELASALCYLHAMHIFHGNIKPANIIVMKVDKLLSVKLSDFGRAEVTLKDRVFHKKSEESFYYMAPEVHLGHPADYRADLYSVGVVMYEMLYGEVPYSTEVTKREFIKNLKEKKPLEFPDFDTRLLSRYCIHLVKNLLNYDKHKRFYGKDLLIHPFIKTSPVYDEQNHYKRAYECYLTSTILAQERKYGAAYIEVMEAVFHIQIYLHQVKDRGQHEHITSKISKYRRYCQIFLERLMSEYITTPLIMPKNTEALRCLLLPSPPLLNAYDLCIRGEMYFRLDDPRAEGMIKKGMDTIIHQFLHEPNGERKELLAEKIQQWMRILESS